MPLKTYDQSMSMLRHALDRAKLGNSDKLDGFRRLDGFVRAIERNAAPQADAAAVIAHERQISKSLGGRTVMDDRKRRSGQLGLFDRG